MQFPGIWFKIKTDPSKKKDGVQNLFSDGKISTKVYLLPNLKKADYFFKNWEYWIHHDALKIKTLLNKIESISTVYSVDTNKINQTI
jgi:hypothetical protein